ncbi:MAG: ATP-binding protein, partial [Humidesulfovibrio sp.]|nr:ATP-binding protein [Humidesulfovibrio sp.]
MNDNFPNIYRTTREKLALPDGFWEAVYEDPDMRGQMRARVLADCASGDAERMYWADVPITRKGQPTTYVTARNVPLPEHGLVISTVWDVTLRKQGEESLNAIKWLVDRGPGRASAQQAFGCDNLVALNSSRLILDAVGPDILRDIVQDFMTMLGTSSAVYEKNGDYALGLFASNWCRVMDQASRDLCQCDDDAQALASGKWLCHESCWTEASRAAIETGRTADISCHGGLRLYAEPIKAGKETVGAINFGYGTPPRDRQAITELAARYRLDPDELWKLSQEYEHRPDFIIDAAKERLKTSARLIGEIVSRSIVEKDLNLAKDAAEAANRAKSEFLANMSHELRTPMNGVLGMLHLLMLEEELKPAQQSYASNAVEAANRLLSLLNDILDFSRIEAGALVFKQEPYQPSDILDATVGVFSHACARKGLALRMEPEPGLPAWLLGDEARIRQIVFNLVGNAVKFTRQGSITVEAWHRILPGAAPDRLLLAVSDTGVGIPEARLGSVFDRFSQVDSSYTRQFEGAGLGLAIVRRIVEHLGGSLCIESEAGAGTSVVLSLPAPVGRGAALAAQADAGANVDAGADAANAEEQVSLRILLAEDEFIGQLGARLMLERMGHSVVAVNDGIDAVAAALKQEFDCVLMDIQMP